MDPIHAHMTLHADCVRQTHVPNPPYASFIRADGDSARQHVKLCATNAAFEWHELYEEDAKIEKEKQQ